jgi:hypothetical protein
VFGRQHRIAGWTLATGNRPTKSTFKLADDPKQAKLLALEDPDLAPLWAQED